jgi:hypothetical protein
MSVIFAHKPPIDQEVEKLRLILSTFQDGTGQLAVANNMTLPGWRDFERSVALAFDGIAQESKAIFDVVLPDPDDQATGYGLSCKMRNTLSFLDQTGRVTIEVSNSAGKFWDALVPAGITMDNLGSDDKLTGRILIELVESWHLGVFLSNRNIDRERSFYLALQYSSKSGYYQLFQFSLDLPNPEELEWRWKGRRLVGIEAGESKPIIEWYGYSGGQLKYYPFADSAIWQSQRFQLEPLSNVAYTHPILRKAAEYFPHLWKAACG